VQFDPSSATFQYGLAAYSLLSFSVFVTAVCSVHNEHLLKQHSVGINVQNFTLYCLGVVLNLFAYALPMPWTTSHSFFEGFGTFFAVATVTANALLGLAITAVYKYADAVQLHRFDQNNCVKVVKRFQIAFVVNQVDFNENPKEVQCAAFIVC